MHRVLGILILLMFVFGARAQVVDDSSIFKYPIQMDEVVITATRSGWDVAAFIRRVQNDTTFYKAFKSLRVVPFTATSAFTAFDKKGRVEATYHSKIKQNRAGNCRTMDVLDEKHTGRFYKRNGDYRYYTAELFAYLFYTEGKVCGENDIVAGALDDKGKGQLEKSKYQLKQLIFNPGSKIGGVPFMGDKAAIFEPDVAKMYDFKLYSEDYNGIECYVFKAVPKPEYKGKVVYNDLTTWFRKTDYSIVARDYSLSYNTLVYDFNVRMKVRTVQIGNKLLPSRIEYYGNWDVVAKSRERVNFTTTFSY